MEKSLKSKLLSGGTWVVGIKLFMLPISLGLNAILSRILSPGEFGVYFLIFSLVNISMLFSLLGMERSIVRLVSESLALKQQGRARKAIIFVLQYGLVSSVFVDLLLLFGIGELISIDIFESELMNKLILFPALWLILFTLQTLVVESFRGLHDIKYATIFNGLISNILSFIVLGTLLIIGLKIKIEVVIVYHN